MAIKSGMKTCKKEATWKTWPNMRMAILKHREDERRGLDLFGSGQTLVAGSYEYSNE
jgi:hypothetical protein